MTARDLYAGILRELDRYQSPSFEPHEFNYFLPKAVNQVILDAYRLYKETSKSSDVLRFYSETISKNLNPKLVDRIDLVPIDISHRYLISVKAIFKVTTDNCSRKQGYLLEFYLNETEEKRLRDLFRNHYLIPNLEEERAYWLIEGKELKIIYASNIKNHADWQISKVDYVAVVDPDLSAFLLPSNFNTASLPAINVPKKLIQLFINTTVEMFLENTLNPRLQTHTTINQ